MPDLTDLESVEKQLSTYSQRIVIADEEPTNTNDVDMSRATADSIRTEMEAGIIGRLSRFYQVPLTLGNESDALLLKSIATRLAAYEIWTLLHGTVSAEDVPAGVIRWKETADDLLKQVVPDNMSSPEPGKAIILQGENVLTSTGDAETPHIAITNGLPYGTTGS